MTRQQNQHQHGGDPLFVGFQRRTRLAGVLRCETALRIGAGREMGTESSDLPVLRQAGGDPFLPGASIKGVLRSQVEALLRAQDARWACDPLGPDACLAPPPGARPSKSDRPAQEEARDFRRKIREQTCRVCRIFGAAGLASHVVCADALPVGRPAIERRDSVSIDRDLGRVSGKRKFDFEVVAAGSRFRFRLFMQDLDDGQEGAVMSALALLEDGFARLGGFKSRGLGLVAFEDMTVEVLDLDRAQRRLRRQQEPWQDYRQRRIHSFESACQTGEGA